MLDKKILNAAESEYYRAYHHYMQGHRIELTKYTQKPSVNDAQVKSDTVTIYI